MLIASASSEGTGESAHMRKVARVFAPRIHNVCIGSVYLHLYNVPPLPTLARTMQVLVQNSYVIVMPWIVRLYVEIIHEL